MEFSLAELIEDSMKVENVDKRKVIKILTDYIKSGCDEKEIYECVYKEVYKDTLLPEMCEEWISMMGNEEHSGAKWNLEETNAVARRLDYNFAEKPYSPEEFRLMMTKEYYAHSIPLKRSGVNLEPSGWGRIADYYFITDDKAKCDLVDKFFCLFK